MDWILARKVKTKLDDSNSMGPGEFATSEMASAFKHNWVDNQGKEPSSKSFIFCYLDKMDDSYLKMTWPNFGRTCIFVNCKKNKSLSLEFQRRDGKLSLISSINLHWFSHVPQSLRINQNYEPSYVLKFFAQKFNIQKNWIEKTIWLGPFSSLGNGI